MLLIVLSFTALGQTLASDDPRIYIVPSEMCRGYFFVPVTLAPKAGYADDRTLWFIFDTGAGSSWVDPDSIERVTGKRLKPGKLVRFAPENPITFEPIKDHGLILSPHKTGFEVTGMIDETPASHADLKKGDLITHWNDEPVANRTCAGDSADATSLVLGIERDGLPLSVELKLFNLVD